MEGEPVTRVDFFGPKMLNDGSAGE